MDVMISDAINRKPVTLKDVYGKNYKTPEEKEALKKKREEAKKAKEKAPSKKKPTAKSTKKTSKAKKEE